MGSEIGILGDSSRKCDLDAILKRGEEYLRKRSLDEKREALAPKILKPSTQTTSGDLVWKCVENPFDRAKEALESEGYDLVSLEQMAMLRIKGGKDSLISKGGNWVREGFIYIRNKGIYLTKSSPIMEKAKEATDCSRESKQFYLTQEQVEKALADSCKVTNVEIPTLRLAEGELTAYAFGSHAKAYGEFLNKSGIDSLNVYPSDIWDMTIARQMWMGGLGVGYYSALYGFLKNLEDDRSRACGVKPLEWAQND